MSLKDGPFLEIPLLKFKEAQPVTLSLWLNIDLRKEWAVSPTSHSLN